MKAQGYFSDLNKNSQDLIIELCKETMEDAPDGYLPGENSDGLEYIECESRDGFIPFDSNRGGVTIKQFTDLMSMSGNGHRVSHVKAQKEIERQTEYSLKCARESFLADLKEELEALSITSADDVGYHELYDIGRSDLAESFSEYENEHLGGEESSIMFEVRFMYHGKSNKAHSASVSCAVNTEGPYHRSSISWAPNVFCEGSKEVEIKWTTQAELKVELKKALAKTVKAVF